MESRTDLDSHADQCAIGRNALLVHDYDRPINVSGYDPNGPVAKDLRTVSGALAYDDAVTGRTVILIVHQAIYIPDLSHNLLSTMQLRLNDVKVNDVPRFLTDQPTELTHSLVIPIEQSDTPYVIPLSIIGVASSFPTRKPTREEYDQLPHIILTSEAPDYDPHDPVYAEQEDALLKYVSDTGDRIGVEPPPTGQPPLCSVQHIFDGKTR
ncbi:Reverse transcriptase (RNA-dependent DNA polymerase) [Fragilaria crotonensis]|nr:Reverse transcriptase (RNA-dependent DNA polymerase) [Fragilaria crotonensis]